MLVSLLWWQYCVIVLVIFITTLGANYVVKKINESRIDERLNNLLQKTSKVQNTKVEDTKLEIELSKASKTKVLAVTTTDKNNSDPAGISLIFNKEDNIISEIKRKKDMIYDNKPNISSVDSSEDITTKLTNNDVEVNNDEKIGNIEKELSVSNDFEPYTPTIPKPETGQEESKAIKENKNSPILPQFKDKLPISVTCPELLVTSNGSQQPAAIKMKKSITNSTRTNSYFSNYSNLDSEIYFDTSSNTEQRVNVLETHSQTTEEFGSGNRSSLFSKEKDVKITFNTSYMSQPQSTFYYGKSQMLNYASSDTTTNRYNRTLKKFWGSSYFWKNPTQIN